MSDVLFLSEQHELRELLDDKKEFSLQDLEEDYISFIHKRGLYDQLRFIDLEGQEVVRVNYNEGNAAKTLKKDLQNKSSRYYFTETIKLNKNEIFISPLDLNKEHGEIERPLKPMIRFAMPVFNSEGEKKGIIILNFLASVLINEFKSFNDFPERKQLLVNSDGYFLVGLSSDDEWGFMFKEKNEKTFKSLYPKSWETIQEEDSGQFHIEEGIFTFTTVRPLLFLEKSFSELNKTLPIKVKSLNNQEYYWKAIHFIPKSFLDEKAGVLIKKFASFYIFFLFIFGFITWYLAKLYINREEAHHALESLNAKLEEEVNKRTAELQVINKTLEKKVDEKANKLLMQEQILFQKSKLAAMGEMIGAIAHQWRQPLNCLGLSIQNLEYSYEYGELTKESIAKMVKESMEMIEHMSSTIDDFRNFFKPSKEKVPFVPDQIIEETIKLSRAQLNAHFIELIYQKETEVEDTITGYPNELKQVLLNLISNASEAIIANEQNKQKESSHKGSIKITNSIENENIIIEVEDSGGGIDEKNINKVFEPYFSTKEATQGTGIGLYMSKTIIEQHMLGQLTVRNGKDGAIFRITLRIMNDRNID
ncbi:MAG: sensor histidine kinase [Nitrospinae bacterium]|nr:sensor histidine kinase [Nitrospinota bacterium]